jgi:DNA-binding MarR family transcriptional regulator
MKDILSDLNKAFESRLRLGIMSILMVNDYADFNTLKDMLEVSDGNLASHISALEKLEYLSVEKKFVGKKTNTTYAATDVGRKAFKEHLDALERLIRGS